MGEILQRETEATFFQVSTLKRRREKDKLVSVWMEDRGKRKRPN